MCLDLLPPFVSLSPLSGSCLGKKLMFLFYFFLFFFISLIVFNFSRLKPNNGLFCGSKQKKFNAPAWSMNLCYRSRHMSTCTASLFLLLLPLPLFLLFLLPSQVHVDNSSSSLNCRCMCIVAAMQLRSSGLFVLISEEGRRPPGESVR